MVEGPGVGLSMVSDYMRVRLHLRQVRALGVVVDTSEELRARVESAVRRLRFPRWGFKCHWVHDIREREVVAVHGCDTTTLCPSKRHGRATVHLDGPPLWNLLSSSRRVRPSPLEIDPLIKLAMVTSGMSLVVLRACVVCGDGYVC